MATYKLTQQSAQFSGSSKTDFPAYVDLTEIDAAMTQAEADSIRVYSDASLSTELAREVVSTEELHVKIPTFVSGDEIWIDIDGVSSDYADNATFGAENVWKSTYELVYHLNEEPTSATAIKDSTSNNRDSTAINGSMTAGDLVAAVIGNGLSFDGNDDIEAPQAWDGSGDGGFSVWFNTAGSASFEDFVSERADSGGTQPNQLAGLRKTDTDAIEYLQRGPTGGVESVTSNSTYGDSADHLVYGFRDGTTVRIDVDGGTDTNSTAADGDDVVDTNNITRVASFDGTSNFATATLDEVRVFSFAPSADWRATEYNNQNSPSTFWSIEEVVSRRVFNIS